MNTLSSVLEKIILDYKTELEYNEKLERDTTLEKMKPVLEDLLDRVNSITYYRGYEYQTYLETGICNCLEIINYQEECYEDVITDYILKYGVDCYRIYENCWFDRYSETNGKRNVNINIV